MGSSQGAAGQNKLWAPFMESPAAHLDLPPLRKEKMVLCNPALPNASPSPSSCWHYSDIQCRRNNVTLRADSLLVLQPPWECQTHIGFFADHGRKNRADMPRSIAPGKASSPCSPEGSRLSALGPDPASCPALSQLFAMSYPSQPWSRSPPPWFQLPDTCPSAIRFCAVYSPWQGRQECAWGSRGGGLGQPGPGAPMPWAMQRPAGKSLGLLAGCS